MRDFLLGINYLFNKEIIDDNMGIYLYCVSCFLNCYKLDKPMDYS